MAEMICPYCKIEFPSDYKWCMEDGSELEQNMGQYDENAEGGTKVPCPDCGEPVDTRDIYCGNCASKIEGRLPQQEPQDDYYDDDESAVEGYQETAEEEYFEEPQGPTRPCPKCGDAVGLADTFCGGCGAQLESAIPASSFDGTIQGRACPHCAGGLEPEDTYCGSCGHTVVPEVESGPSSICGSCGMEITHEDTFCGTCGAPVQQQKEEAPAQEPFVAPSSNLQPDQNYSAVAAGSCPNCGMDITPDDTFCGTCGASTAPAAQVSTPEPAASFIGGDESYEASSSGSCPNCGMDITPEDTFCGTCGASTSSANQDSPSEPSSNNNDESYEDMSTPEQSSPVSISDYTKDIPVCPSCGIQGEPGQTSCYTCCVDMTTEDTLAPGAPSSFNEDTSYTDDNVGSDGFQAPEMGAPSEGEKICSCCGVSSPPEAEFCGNCGIDF